MSIHLVSNGAKRKFESNVISFKKRYESINNDTNTMIHDRQKPSSTVYFPSDLKNTRDFYVPIQRVINRYNWTKDHHRMTNVD